ncbi:MAG TPA: amino acid adenylation domain-containing protein [Candidatus Krumholzibacteria bacterium]|nr:amino acid adenylation domain-containing protein [Candidatus Krumholzibacteria bacterium]
MTLQRYLDETVARFPERAAVREPGGASVTYRELGELSDRLRDRLASMGVAPGDRVGIYLRKSIDTVAAIFGVLKTGAAYVPVDPSAPPSRNGYIFANCSVKVAITERRFEPGLRKHLSEEGAADTPLFVIDEAAGGAGLRAALDAADAATRAPRVATVHTGPDALAYILYTSGSTGKPKGVILTQRNATSFVDWCSETFAPAPEDVFSSHAPFHFDLSILDIYTPLKHGASLALVPEDIGKDPQKLARLIHDARITVWYSTPSVLSLLVQYGKLEDYDLSHIRTILFAGEVFPIVHLKALHALLPAPRYFNLYGPTETNVCTFFELPPAIPSERVDPFPIGMVCSHLEAVVVDDAGDEVGRGERGELCIRGASVTPGYWNLPEQTAKAYLTTGVGARDAAKGPWYKTGDVVTEETGGVYVYAGRKDRMVKKRGYRVELGEIESCLYRHPDVREAAVVAIPDDELGLKVRAHLATRDGGRLSVIALKGFCAQHLPVYMIPDVFSFHAELPKTSTEKTDYQALMRME